MKTKKLQNILNEKSANQTYTKTKNFQNILYKNLAKTNLYENKEVPKYLE